MLILLFHFRGTRKVVASRLMESFDFKARTRGLLAYSRPSLRPLSGQCCQHCQVTSGVTSSTIRGPRVSAWCRHTRLNTTSLAPYHRPRLSRKRVKQSDWREADPPSPGEHLADRLEDPLRIGPVVVLDRSEGWVGRVPARHPYHRTAKIEDRLIS